MPLHNVMRTVEGEHVQLNCLFKGNLAVLSKSLSSYWTVNFPPFQQGNTVIHIDDNSTYPYCIAVYQTCLTSNGSCCNFTNQLTILNTSSLLDGVQLTCTESLNVAGSKEPVIHTSSTTIGKCYNN